MLRRLWYSQFPEWARPDHPIMRSIMGRAKQVSRRRKLLRNLLLIVATVGVAGLGYALNEEVTLRDAVYPPLVFLQIMAVIIGLSITANAVATEQQRGTWDTLKLTITGVPLTLRARWIAVFQQLRWLLLVIFLGRVFYMALLFQDIAEFQGRALDLYITGITPEVSLDVAILLMVAFMTAFVMQPFIAVGVSAAIGVLFSVLVNSRAMIFILTLVVIGAYLGLVFVGITYANEQVLERTEALIPEQWESQEGWTSVMFMALEGDMGISLTELETQAQIWADLEYGVYFGGIYLAVIFISGLLSNFLVVLCANRAAKPTRL